MPVTLLYGLERARVARLVLNLLRTVRNAYTPELTLEEASEFLFLMMHLFIGHAQGKLLSASKLARVTEMPRTTVLRRLTALIELSNRVKPPFRLESRLQGKTPARPSTTVQFTMLGASARGRLKPLI